MPLPAIATSLNNLTRGAKLLTEPELRPFVLIPLAINAVLFALLTFAVVTWIGNQVAEAEGWMPGWLSWVSEWGLFSWLLSAFWLLFGSLLWIAYGYTFGIVANIIAAPFNGILAEKIEERLTGLTPPEESLASMCVRTVGRELQKLGYFLVRGCLLLLLFFVLWWIPGLNLLIPVIGWLWGAWSMALQYLDYPADNHQIAFTDLRREAWTHKWQSLSFGGYVMLGNMIPFFNILMMPIAVAGATVQRIEQAKSGEHA